jgi:hypothetical protein
MLRKTFRGLFPSFVILVLETETPHAGLVGMYMPDVAPEGFSRRRRGDRSHLRRF